MNKTDKQIYDVKTRVLALEGENNGSGGLNNYYNELVNLAGHNNELDNLAGHNNTLDQLCNTPYVGNFAANTSNGATITISSVPYKPRAIIFHAQAYPGIHVGFDNGNNRGTMGIYFNGTTPLSGVSINYSWMCRASIADYTYGKVETLTDNGFTTIQTVGGAGFAGNVHYMCFP